MKTINMQKIILVLIPVLFIFSGIQNSKADTFSLYQITGDVFFGNYNTWEAVGTFQLDKASYKAGDTVGGEKYHLLQYTMKILLNSLYGATALPTFRYGNVILSEAITLSGQRIIQESALCANRHMNQVIRGEIKLEI